MTNTQTTTQAAGDSAADEFDVLGFLLILARRKKLILLFPLVTAVIAVAISFALPNVYRASTKLLPPQQAQSSASALLSQLGGAAGMVAGVTGLKNPTDQYIGMLKSRTVADRLIQTFQLQKVYDTDSLEKARRILESNTTIVAGKDGLLTIDVEDENQKLVAPLANAYVAELVTLTKTLAVTEAAQRRLFFERQLELSKDNLAKAEMILKRGLETHGVISVDSDSRAMLEMVGRVRAKISAKEIQLSSMQAFVTTDNHEYRRAREELNSLRAELSKLEDGRPARDADLSKADTKRVGLENIKILREVKYHQMLYELLAKQYEVARLDEARDASLIQVLDPAVEPERKFKPKRAIIGLFWGFAAFILAIFGVIIIETKQRLSRTVYGQAQLRELKSHFRP